MYHRCVGNAGSHVPPWSLWLRGKHRYSALPDLCTSSLVDLIAGKAHSCTMNDHYVDYFMYGVWNRRNVRLSASGWPWIFVG
jgi:hypothetical protein